MSPRFDAIVLAHGEHAQRRVAGLTLARRAQRVAEKAGADVVYIVRDLTELAAIARGLGGKPADTGLLIIDGSTLVVHTPLITPLLHADATGLRRKAVSPDGRYAGALYAANMETAIAAVTQLAALGSDRELAKHWGEAATPYVHGDIARHPATTPTERKQAQDMLFGLVHKATDNAVTRYLYRPVSRPLTKLFLLTPITPNQISGIVAILGLASCLLVARGNHRDLIWGAVLAAIAGFIDCCDGEVARLRHLSSKWGAWLDTIIDELSSVGYIVAIGLHTYHRTHEAWVMPSLWVGVIASVISLYIIYYFDLLVAKTGNSQNYAGSLEIVDDPLAGMALSPKRTNASTSPLVARFQPLLYAVVRRDFINLACVAMAVADVYRFNFAIMVVATVVMLAIVFPEHIRLRRLLGQFAAAGAPIRYVP